jgi:hypothetical protein
MDHRPGFVVFITTDRFPGPNIDMVEPVEPASDEDRVNRRGWHPESTADRDRP